MQLRYHWLPAIFSVGVDDEVKIQTAVHYTLKRSDPELTDLYRGLEAAFSAMVPMFRDLGVLPCGASPTPHINAISHATGLPLVVADIVRSYLNERWRTLCTRQVRYLPTSRAAQAR